MQRRKFLAGAGAFIAGRAWGFGQEGRADVAELQFSSGTVSRPEAWKRLLFELVGTTSVETEARVVQVAPDDPALFQHPFAVLCGDGSFGPLSPTAREQVVRYLTYGGFLFVDDTSGSLNSAFDASVRQMCRELFPTRALDPLSSDHSVYRSFFLLQQPVGRLAISPALQGLAHTSTHPLIYSQNDLSGALDRRADGSNRLACSPGGEDQRREALKLGINLMMYALTSNYKQDQAHVNELMREGRLE